VFEKLLETSLLLIGQEELITPDRKALLDELSIYVAGKFRSSKKVDLLFICTHNSRRSHMAQVWARAASNYYNIQGINTYSGGTQLTAFNKNAVNALRKAGFKVFLEKEGANPTYKTKVGRNTPPVMGFSKVYSHKINPQENFVAVMTCNAADEACPVVKGAYYRTSITYEDPKKYDGTDQAETAYERTSLEIGREMFYVFKKVREILGII
jgi:protein-tyrosine-phosphatase